ALYELRLRGDTSQGRARIPFRLAYLRDDSLMLFVAIATAAEWNDALSGVIEFLYPLAYQPFLRQPELRATFRSLEQTLPSGQKIRLRRVSSTRRLLRSRSRRSFASEIAWTDLDVDDAFNQAAENLAYFKKLAFEVCKEDSEGALRPAGVDGTIARD